jgi:hypothetical protein
MVIAEPCKGQNPKEEVNVQVVTRGGIQTGMDLEREESSSKNEEGKIRKVVKAPSKFHVVEKNQFIHEAQKALEKDNAREEARRTM